MTNFVFFFYVKVNFVETPNFSMKLFNLQEKRAKQVVGSVRQAIEHISVRAIFK